MNSCLLSMILTWMSFLVLWKTSIMELKLLMLQTQGNIGFLFLLDAVFLIRRMKTLMTFSKKIDIAMYENKIKRHANDNH